MPDRAACYIDGFNVYYAVKRLGIPHLKWVNLWQLAESLLPKNDETLTRVVWCSAFNKRDYSSLSRHQKYEKALRHYGVTTVMGHYIESKMDCRSCKHEWQMASEKETDVNLGLSLFDDARQDRFDHAYLMTADSDQGATARFLRECFPNKKLTSVAPGAPQARPVAPASRARRRARARAGRWPWREHRKRPRRREPGGLQREAR